MHGRDVAVSNQDPFNVVCSETRQKVEKQVHIVIPEGTKVLTRPGGRVGIVAHAPSAPEHSYRVRFADGGPEESFRRVDLTIFKHVQMKSPAGLTSQNCTGL